MSSDHLDTLLYASGIPPLLKQKCMRRFDSGRAGDKVEGGSGPHLSQVVAASVYPQRSRFATTVKYMVPAHTHWLEVREEQDPRSPVANHVGRYRGHEVRGLCA
jgi:hypothetical protein